MQRPLWNLLNYAHCTVWWFWSQIYERFWFQGDGEKPWRYSFSKVEMERLSFLLNISWNHQLIINGWQGFGNDDLSCFIDIANSIWPLYLGVHPMVLDNYSPLSASLFDTNINCLLPTIFRCNCISIQSRLLKSNWLIFWRNFGLFLVLGQVSLSNNIIHSFCPSYFLFSFCPIFSEFYENISDDSLFEIVSSKSVGGQIKSQPRQSRLC